ncbi:MAG: Hsp20/alpha crystallin family protein [Thermoproteota archaeon]
MEDFERIMDEVRSILGEDSRRRRISRVGYIEPLYNVVETGDEIRVSVDLPGVEKEDIRLTLYEDHLVIEGVCRKDTPSVRRLAGERPLYYSVSIPLPAKVEEEPAKAKYLNGILEISLVKRKRGRQIQIE